MKRILIIISLAFVATMLSITAYAHTLKITTTNNTYLIDFSNVTQLSFPQPGTVGITLSDGSTFNCSDNNLLRLSFTNEAGIERATINEEGLSVINGVLSSAYPVEVIDASGKIVLQAEPGQIDLTHLQSGIYIARSEAVTLKFAL